MSSARHFGHVPGLVPGARRLLGVGLLSTNPASAALLGDYVRSSWPRPSSRRSDLTRVGSSVRHAIAPSSRRVVAESAPPRRARPTEQRGAHAACVPATIADALGREGRVAQFAEASILFADMSLLATASELEPASRALRNEVSSYAPLVERWPREIKTIGDCTWDAAGGPTPTRARRRSAAGARSTERAVTTSPTGRASGSASLR